MFRRTLILTLLVLAAADAAIAQVQPPDYGFQWRTVGAPGNRPANQQEAPRLYPPYSNPPISVGSVGYTYRMTQTVVTAGQWLEFLNAYWPYYTGFYADPALTSNWILPLNPTPGQNPNYYLNPANVNKPVNCSWRFAARYLNWLNNDRGTTQAAFETGAYDTSTFTQNPDHTYNDQEIHTPGARYWLPTLDEWSKGFFFDPNKNGPGQAGYWRYPIGSDAVPISGYPWQGGQTGAGIPFGSGPILDVGSFANSLSPWGFLDGSGCIRQWLEGSGSGLGWPYDRGTSQFDSDWDLFDRLDWIDSTDPTSGGYGFRIASTVPGPGAWLALPLTTVLAFKRRNR